MVNKSKALFPLVKEQIHFDKLIQDSLALIDVYSGEVWSDTDAHDPGITMLEAIAYAISDLSYRTSLPLVDLLTPEKTEQGEGIFPESFGPQQILTVGPITIDDYRRALLDLNSSDEYSDDENRYFYFRDVQLIREPESSRYSYWHDPENHTYTFNKPDIPGEGVKRFSLLGNYVLYIEPTREGYNNQSAAKTVLDDFLRNNRNLCEKVQTVVWLQRKDIFPKFIIELEDDAREPAQILASIYTTVENYVSPLVSRYSAEVLMEQGTAIEDIYEGPQMRHGWITNLPPQRLSAGEPIVIDLSGLVSNLLAIESIKSIQSFGGGNTGDWIFSIESGYFPLAWGSDPLYNLSSLDDVKVFKRGQRYKATKAEIQAALDASRPEILTEAPRVLPLGNWRNPGAYHPATDWLPPCYDLQNRETSEQTLQLHRFLLPFEQELANGCAQLALLPELLSFKRTANSSQWGKQWPFADGSVSDVVHQDYKTDLIAMQESNAPDFDHELQLIDYLLGYFGAERAPRTLATPVDDFLTTQQGYLAELGELGYHRANIRSDQVSALQKRIAARLGYGGALFGESIDLGKLPFYLIENRALLPLIPQTSTQERFAIGKVEQNDSMLMLYTDVAKLMAGEIIDLLLDDNGTLQTLSVRAVSEGAFQLSVADDSLLTNNVDRVLAAAEAGTLQWRSSNVWLTTMAYQLTYADDQSGLADNERRLGLSPLSPFPVFLKVGEEITLEQGFGPLTPEMGSSDSSVTVVSLDPLHGTYVFRSAGEWPAPAIASKYRWYQRETAEDKYSFTISLVFNQNMLSGLADPATTEQWIRQVVSAEIPANVGVRFYWFNVDQFRSFAATYKRWQAGDELSGDYAYQLLFQLALGMKPQVELGVGLMQIASTEQRLEVVGTTEDQWNTTPILTNTLFYVPAKAGVHSLAGDETFPHK